MEPVAKKQKYAGSYQPSWNNMFKGTIRESKLGSQHAWCTVCCRDIKVAASGVYDVREHIKSKLHERQLHCGQVTNFVKAEVLFANFMAEQNLPALLAEHNLPVLLADHFTDLARLMFPDSDIAKRFRCKRTKIMKRCPARQRRHPSLSAAAPHRFR